MEQPIKGTDAVLRENPDGRQRTPEEQEALEQEKVEHIARLRADDGEVLFAQRGRSVDSVLYAALDHRCLADYLLKEWAEELGDESAAELVIRLLGDYKIAHRLLAMVAKANAKAKEEGHPILTAEWTDEAMTLLGGRPFQETYLVCWSEQDKVFIARSSKFHLLATHGDTPEQALAFLLPLVEEARQAQKEMESS